MGKGKTRYCLDFEGVSCTDGQNGGPKTLSKLCNFLGPGLCGEQRCAGHCWCARHGLRIGASAGRSRVVAQPPSATIRCRQQPPATTSNHQPGASSGRSRSPRHLRITPAELENRMRSQNRLAASRHGWALEVSWGYGPEVVTWGQAVGHFVTRRWLASLDQGRVYSVKLQIFLRWVRQQQQQQQQGAQQPSITAVDALIPPCVVCLSAPPVWACSPCMHLCTCGPCSVALRDEAGATCPLCRDAFLDIVRIFY
jgi:hypothetical protein